jgi:hypothetical protein
MYNSHENEISSPLARRDETNFSNYFSGETRRDQTPKIQEFS